MRITVIDGHNLILGVRSLAERVDFDGKRASRKEAETLILAWAEREGDMAVRLVYDGRRFEGSHPESRDEGPLRVRFSDPPAEADDLILHEAMDASLRADSVTVVTGDKELARSVEELGARVVDPAEFYRELVRRPPGPDKEHRFSADEIEALHEEMLGRGEGEEVPAAREATASPPRTVKAAPPKPKTPKQKRPAVQQGPKKEERREKFEAKQKRAKPKSKPKSRKKRRGF
ncbi:MAG: NYN domain-containing protein [Candidatus Eisenbacteria bacterium]